MQRSDVINRFLKLYEDPRYLEVGVDEGTTFFAVDARQKVAVDPAFKFPIPDAVGLLADVEFHPVESDLYFEKSASGQFDIIFLDGLHTFEQIVKDFTNALAYIKPNGIIIIDDVIPSSYYASMPDLDRSLQFRRRLGFSDWDWMGDVYKIVYLIESFFQSYSFATVAENHGQMIVWRETRSANALSQRTIESIGRMSYSDAVLADGFALQECEIIVERCEKALNL